MPPPPPHRERSCNGRRCELETQQGTPLNIYTYIYIQGSEVVVLVPLVPQRPSPPPHSFEAHPLTHRGTVSQTSHRYEGRARDAVGGSKRVCVCVCTCGVFSSALVCARARAVVVSTCPQVLCFTDRLPPYLVGACTTHTRTEGTPLSIQRYPAYPYRDTHELSTARTDSRGAALPASSTLSRVYGVV